MPRLTTAVVIPCHNAELLLAEALASVARQTRAPDEVIVVDDASADRSFAVAARAGANCVRLTRNAGPAAARNAAIDRASSDVVAFLDADDLWDPEHLDTLVSLLERSPPDVGVAFTRMRVIGGAEILNNPPVEPGVPFDALLPLLGWNFVAQSAAAVRRTLVTASDGYDETARLAEDYRLWLDLARSVRFVYSDAVTASYRRHDTQQTTNNARLFFETWRARAAVTAPGWLGPQHPAVETVTRYLRAIYARELRTAWLDRNRPVFRAILEGGATVPGNEGLHRVWRRRERLAWSAWVVVAAVMKRLPEPLRAVLRLIVGGSAADDLHAGR